MEIPIFFSGIVLFDLFISMINKQNEGRKKRGEK